MSYWPHFVLAVGRLRAAPGWPVFHSCEVPCAVNFRERITPAVPPFLLLFFQLSAPLLRICSVALITTYPCEYPSLFPNKRGYFASQVVNSCANVRESRSNGLTKLMQLVALIWGWGRSVQGSKHDLAEFSAFLGSFLLGHLWLHPHEPPASRQEEEWTLQKAPPLLGQEPGFSLFLRSPSGWLSPRTLVRACFGDPPSWLCVDMFHDGHTTTQVKSIFS